MESKDTNKLIYKTENNSEMYRTDRQMPRRTGIRRGGIGTLGLADVNNYIENIQTTNHTTSTKIY